MNQMILEQLLKANLDLNQHTFLNDLRVDATFSKGKFNELVHAVFTSNQSGISQDERTRLGGLLWEVLFLALSSMYHDKNKADIYSFEGLTKEEKTAVIEQLYFIGNSYWYGKEFDFRPIML